MTNPWALIDGVGAGCITIVSGLLLLNRLAPSVLTEWLKARWELERDAISLDRSRELEQFKSSLEVVLERYKVSISTLHDARALIISELYAKLLEAWRGWERIQFHSVSGASWQPALDEGLHFNSEFRSIYYRGRLYLTNNANELLYRALQSLQQMGSAASIHTSNVEQLVTNAYRRMDDTLLELQQPLEKEFRLILGTEDSVRSLQT